MTRTDSMNIRDEREDLKQAAEHSLNVILDLGLDGIIQWVSPSWKDVIGTPSDAMKGQPIAHLLISDKDAFARAVESMRKDDSRSQIVRFQVHMGGSSVLRLRSAEGGDGLAENNNQDGLPADDDDQILALEGQGIMVYDRASGSESHVCVRLSRCSCI